LKETVEKTSLPNVTFLATLWKKNAIRSTIADEIIDALLGESATSVLNENKIEAGCVFILASAEKMESVSRDKVYGIIQKLEELKEQVTSRIRFKIMDVLDTYKAGWKVHKAEAGPSKFTIKP
jgi:hypothetical protein